MNSKMQPHNLWGMLRSHLHRPTPALDVCWSLLSMLDAPSQRRTSTYVLHAWAHQADLSFGREASLSHLLDIASWAAPSSHHWRNLNQPSWRVLASALYAQRLHPAGLDMMTLTWWLHDIIEEICHALPRHYAESSDLPKIAARAQGMLADIELARALLRQGHEARHPVCYHLGGEQLRGHLWSLQGDMYQVESLLDAILPLLGRRLVHDTPRREIESLRWRVARLQDASLLARLEHSLARALVRAAATA